MAILLAPSPEACRPSNRSGPACQHMQHSGDDPSTFESGSLDRIFWEKPM